MKKLFVLFIITVFSVSLIQAFENFDNNELYCGQRNGLSSLIDNSQLKDSLREKAYCAFYTSGCYGIGLWMIAVDNVCSYSVFYTDLNQTKQHYQYRIVHLPKEDERMQQLFSLIFSAHEYEQKVVDSHYTPFIFYFTICNANHEIVLEWNQNTRLLNNKTNSPDKVFIPICLSLLFPELY